jgi:hypothetical protein
MVREGAGASVQTVAGEAASAAEQLFRIETLHWPPHSREENAGPDE